jgi:cellulose synthase operon protein C
VTRALTLAAVGVIAAVLVVGLVGWRPMSTAVHGSDPSAANPAPLSGQVARLRALPLVEPDGALAAELADGLDVSEVASVHAAADRLAARAGVAEIMPGLWQRLGHPQLDRPDRSYPYRYPGMSDWLQEQLTPVRLAHRTELIDLAGLLVLDAAHRVNTLPIADYFAGTAAYVILDALATAYPEDCDVAFDLAGLVALGQRPRAWVIDHAFQRAVDACPDDPSPRWWWVHQQAVWSSPALGLNALGIRSGRAMSRPLRTARAWQRAQPGSALPWAAEADALMTEATVMREERVMPFTTRNDASRALALMRRADELEHDPAFVAGQARAQSLLGMADEAADTMAHVVAEAPHDGAFRELDVALLESARRWPAAAKENAFLDVDPADPAALVPDGIEPTTLGATHANAVTIADATETGLGGGAVLWLGYIPDYRDTQTLPGTLSAWCNGLTALRLAVVTGDLEEADRVRNAGARGCWRGLSPQFDPAHLERNLVEYEELKALTAQLEGDPARRDTWLRVRSTGLEEFYDDAQNLFRWAGQLDRAEDIVRAWTSELPGDPVAEQRRGEILYLEGRYGDAQEHFRAAAATPLDVAIDPAEGSFWSSARRAQANLDLGTALEADGQVAAALTAYRDAAREPVRPGRYDLDNQNLLHWSVAAAWSRIGYAELAEGARRPALRALREADRRVRNEENRGREHRRADPVRDSLTSGTEANNLAVALLDAGDDTEEAVDAARRAVAHDQASPVFLDTLGQALQLAGEPERAARAYLAAVRQDATLFQSWNNLGVLRADAGDREGAIRAFRMAVRARPDYALAWFNLGGELGRGGGIRDFVASQRALARAVRLDPGMRGRSPVPLADTGAEITGLDVSRPVPVGWSFGTVSRDPTPVFGWVVLVLALWRLGLAVGIDQAGSWVGGRLLGGTTVAHGWTHLWHRANRFVPLAWALIGAVAVLAWPLGRSVSGQRWQLAVTVAAVAALLWLYARAGRLAADAGVQRRGWLPGILFGGVSALVGYAFVPMPVDDKATTSRARWTGCVLLAVVAAVLLGVAWFAGTPLLRILGLAALTMLATALFPLKPYDGGFLHARGPALLVSLALLAVSSAVVLGWV